MARTRRPRRCRRPCSPTRTTRRGSGKRRRGRRKRLPLRSFAEHGSPIDTLMEECLEGALIPCLRLDRLPTPAAFTSLFLTVPPKRCAHDSKIHPSLPPFQRLEMPSVCSPSPTPSLPPLNQTARSCHRTPDNPHQLEDDTTQHHEQQHVCPSLVFSSCPRSTSGVGSVDVQSQTLLIGGFCGLSFFLSSLGGLPRLAASARAYASLARRCWGVCAYSTVSATEDSTTELWAGRGYHCE